LQIKHETTEQNSNVSLYNLSSNIPVTTVHVHYPSPFFFVVTSVTMSPSMNIWSTSREYTYPTLWTCSI